MIGPKLSPQKKIALMEARQQAALRQEEQALDATRAKTARLKAQRLEKEYRDSLKPKKPAPTRAKRSTKMR